ncbi:MAG: decaprenyl-phosphate phosphoribosyltransferase [bacterium]
MMIKEFIQTMRPGQATKNLLVFAAIIFAQKLCNLEAILDTVFAFICFCIISGCGYVFNDILDLKQDRIHPEKKNRPIASGKLKILPSLTLSIGLIIIVLVLSFLIRYPFGLVITGYVLLTISYSLWLKNIVILDVLALSAGFVFRVVGGAVVIPVVISPWLVGCTMLLALFLSLGKRRHELILLNSSAASHRPILKEYTPAFIDEMIAAVTGSILIAYSFYAFSPDVQKKLNAPYLPLTIIFVLYGIFRYLYLVHQKSAGGNPDVDIIKDKPLLLNILLWIIAVIVIIYWKPMG